MNFVIDQSHYCLSILKQVLEPAGGAKKNGQFHAAPLPVDLVFTAEDCSAMTEIAEKMQTMVEALEDF